MLKSYHYGDIFTIQDTEFIPIPMPIPPEEYSNCSFTMLLWNQHKTATIKIKYGDMFIQLPPSTSIVLDFQPYDLIAKGVYAKMDKAGEIADLQVIITGMEIPMYIMNSEDIKPMPSPNPIPAPVSGNRKLYLIGLMKVEGD